MLGLEVAFAPKPSFSMDWALKPADRMAAVPSGAAAAVSARCAQQYFGSRVKKGAFCGVFDSLAPWAADLKTNRL